MLLFLVCVFSVFATGNRPQELPKVASTIFQQTERDHSVWWSYVHANWWLVGIFHSAWPDGSFSERRCQDQAPTRSFHSQSRQRRSEKQFGAMQSETIVIRDTVVYLK